MSERRRDFQSQVKGLKLPRITLIGAARAVQVLLVLLIIFACGLSAVAQRQTLNFNPGWKFIKADPQGAAQSQFDDESWQTVSTPHTFNDSDTFDDWSLSGHRGEQNQWSGRTWYRKSFSAGAFVGRNVFLEFEGVRQVAEVYLNGQLLGVSKSGFTPFGFDLTPYLNYDRPNVLAVMCDNRFMKDQWAADGPAAKGRGNLADLSEFVNAAIPEEDDLLVADKIPWNNPHWHPAHGGIFRNVYLHITDPLHITLPLYSFLQTAGPYAYATEISAEAATVSVEVPVQNGRAFAQGVDVEVQLLDASGKNVLKLSTSGSIPVGGTNTFLVSGRLAEPKLWEPAYPQVYTVNCILRSEGKVVDKAAIPLGIRQVRWDAASGFYINGKHLKLHGWGQKPTDEWPGIGAALPDWLHYYTLQLMKDAGANIVRWGHCAGPPAGIRAADQLGMVVIQPGVDGESDTRGAAWRLRSLSFRDVIIYYRNNPSIVIWEGGNQKVSKSHVEELHRWVELYDPHGSRAYTHRRSDAVTAGFMDVALGTEGGRENPQLPVVEGEYNREESPRRVWDDKTPPNFGYPEAQGQTYKLTSEQYAVNQAWHYMSKLGSTAHSGGANWIFSDSTSGGRVSCEVARAGGEVDGVRLPKEAYYVCRAMFRADPQVHIIGHWNYPANTRKTVYVAANTGEVKLFLNGRELGQPAVTNKYIFVFSDVPWVAGELKAVAYKDGRSVATSVKRTTGPAVALRLTEVPAPGRLAADGSDIALIDVEAIDEAGQRCPTFQQPVQFRLEGPATWLGGYESGSTNSIHNTKLSLEAGINRVAVRAHSTAGKIRISASAQGLRDGKITLDSEPFKTADGVASALPKTPAFRMPRKEMLAFLDTMPVDVIPASSVKPAGPSRYLRSFSYSGTAPEVKVQPGAQDGSRVYADREVVFKGLPASLAGADYVQASSKDSSYNAVDLMELSLKPGVVVFIAHDDRLARPSWLLRQFKPLETKLSVAGCTMSVFQRLVEREEGLTLGANFEDGAQKECNMYIVFIRGKEPVLSAVSREDIR